MAALFGPNWSNRTLFGDALERRRWEHPMQRMNWTDICRREEYAGRWVALDGCRYDSGSGRATEGAVIDADEDLVELMNRIRESDRQGCEILFCGSEAPEATAVASGDEDPFRNTSH